MAPRVLFVVADGRTTAQELAAATSHELSRQGLDCVTIDLVGDPAEAALQLEGQGADFVVALGGDGTFLRCARLAHRLDVPILGLNFGRVGYLLQNPPDDLSAALLDLVRGYGEFENRSVIALHVNTDSHDREMVVINEATIERTLPGHTVRVKVSVDGDSFLDYAADGIVVASPLGSTAYNLSAGGPIVLPDLDVMIVTPVAPHLTVDRSLIVGGNQIIDLQISGERPAICVVDGVGVASLEHGHKVQIRRHERRLKVASASATPSVSRLRAGLKQSHEL